VDGRGGGADEGAADGEAGDEDDAGAEDEEVVADPLAALGAWGGHGTASWCCVRRPVVCCGVLWRAALW